MDLIPPQSNVFQNLEYRCVDKAQYKRYGCLEMLHLHLVLGIRNWHPNLVSELIIRLIPCVHDSSLILRKQNLVGTESEVWLYTSDRIYILIFFSKSLVHIFMHQIIKSLQQNRRLYLRRNQYCHQNRLICVLAERRSILAR